MELENFITKEGKKKKIALLVMARGYGSSKVPVLSQVMFETRPD